jgi:hypothetical protein
MLSVFVWDASVLEGNPFTYPEVKTLLDSVTVGGRKISNQEQVLNLTESPKHLLALVKANQFKFNKATFTDLQIPNGAQLGDFSVQLDLLQTLGHW